MTDNNFITYGLVGEVSTGKTTFLNSIIGKYVGEMSIKRATMAPYIFTNSNKDYSKQNIKEYNNKLKENKNGDENKQPEPVIINIPINLANVKNKVNDLKIIDFPGINDGNDVNQKFQKLIFDYSKEINCFIYFTDANRAFNLASEIKVFEELVKKIKQNHDNFIYNDLWVVFNKYDDPDNKEVNEIVNEAIKKMNDIINSEFGDHEPPEISFFNISSHNIIINQSAYNNFDLSSYPKDVLIDILKEYVGKKEAKKYAKKGEIPQEVIENDEISYLGDEEELLKLLKKNLKNNYYKNFILDKIEENLIVIDDIEIFFNYNSFLEDFENILCNNFIVLENFKHYLHILGNDIYDKLFKRFQGIVYKLISYYEYQSNSNNGLSCFFLMYDFITKIQYVFPNFLNEFYDVEEEILKFLLDVDFEFFLVFCFLFIGNNNEYVNISPKNNDFIGFFNKTTVGGGGGKRGSIRYSEEECWIISGKKTGKLLKKIINNKFECFKSGLKNSYFEQKIRDREIRDTITVDIKNNEIDYSSFGKEKDNYKPPIIILKKSDFNPRDRQPIIKFNQPYLCSYIFKNYEFYNFIIKKPGIINIIDKKTFQMTLNNKFCICNYPAFSRIALNFVNEEYSSDPIKNFEPIYADGFYFHDCFICNSELKKSNANNTTLHNELENHLLNDKFYGLEPNNELLHLYPSKALIYYQMKK